MDHIVRALEDSELTEAEFNGFGEAEAGVDGYTA